MAIASITLYIDHDTYAEEAEQPLTQERLQRIAEDVNEDAASIYGYESFDYRLVTS